MNQEPEYPQYRDDITCPKSGEAIPLDRFSISKFTERIYFIWCPDCRVYHQFVAKVGRVSPRQDTGKETEAR